jgi:hypothetical protein
MKILIVGTGKSGTTALAYAIKQGFQDYELIFEPKTLTALNYQKESFIVKSINTVQNSLWKEEKSEISMFDKKILIIRHPFDAIISVLLYDPFNRLQFDSDENVKTYIDIIKRKVEQPNLVSLDQIMQTYQKIVGFDFVKVIKIWYKELIEMSINKELGFFVLKYEDFVEGKLESINCYLGLDNLNYKVEVDSQFARVSRTKKHSDWKNWFSQKDINDIEPHFIDFIQKFSYDTNLVESLGVIEPKTSYLYTINVVNEARRNKGLTEYETSQ